MIFGGLDHGGLVLFLDFGRGGLHISHLLLELIDGIIKPCVLLLGGLILLAEFGFGCGVQRGDLVGRVLILVQPGTKLLDLFLACTPFP